ncbi:Receptor-interacting serine/threonine-protein kinase 4 [Fusarium oxysporum f. sp. albedinis]|nr:Receptor-interacting serine/threonine-protein kinase 4 [Fusarium oxysporum f. sp. albedinis]
MMAPEGKVYATNYVSKIGFGDLFWKIRARLFLRFHKRDRLFLSTLRLSVDHKIVPTPELCNIFNCQTNLNQASVDETMLCVNASCIDSMASLNARHLDPNLNRQSDNPGASNFLIQNQHDKTPNLGQSNNRQTLKEPSHV